MVVQENELNFGNRFNVLNLLESMNDISINSKCATTIPIMEHTMGDNVYHLIQLEDLKEFAEYNDIEDYGFALNTVCESSSIDPNSIVFTIQEHHAIEDINLANLGSMFLNEGLNVSLIPLSEDDEVSKCGNYCLEQAKNDGNYEYWLGEVFVSLQEGLFDNYKMESDGKYVSLFIVDPKTKERKLLKKIHDETYKGHQILDLDTLKKVTNNNTDEIFNFLLKSKNIPQNAKEALRYDINKAGYSKEDAIKRFSQKANPFAAGFYNVFNGGEMYTTTSKIDEKTGEVKVEEVPNHDFNKRLYDQYVKYRNIKDFSKAPGDALSSKETREDESKFNAAKQGTLERLKYAKENLGNLDVRGLNDDPNKAKQRIEELSKMVEKEKFPKSWLSKKIAWLRSLYRNIMYKLTLNKSSGAWKSFTNPLRSLAGFILRVIDKLALKLQNAVA